MDMGVDVNELSHIRTIQTRVVNVEIENERPFNETRLNETDDSTSQDFDME